jgi:hypothetical protein
MLVTNVVGTSGQTCYCSDWLDHWRKASSQTAKLCSEKTCNSSDLVGAHVRKHGTWDSTVYIVPLCQKHNKTTEVIDIVDYRELVRADKSACKR